MKLRNEYLDLIDAELFRDVPKAVLAAIAISYTMQATPGEDMRKAANEFIATEWYMLNQAGIVPQRPSKKAKEIADAAAVKAGA